jgi:hypothetical protein
MMLDRASTGIDEWVTSVDGLTWVNQGALPGGSGVFWTGHVSGGGSSAVGDIIPMISTDRRPVSPGVTSIAARGYVLADGGGEGRVGLAWYDSSNVFISYSWAAAPVTGVSTSYKLSAVTATAPNDAATVAFVWGGGGSGAAVHCDNAEWDYAFTAPISELIFRAVQPASGFSDGTEPVWPTVLGVQVIDNTVTWEAISANRIVWTATAILKSGPIEPTFPALDGAVVADNTIAWLAVTRRVEDENCPNTKQVAIASSKIFAADKDIVPFSATINPLDWTTTDDAGFIPFGLNSYGSQDITALGLYRSNLVVFNSKAFQMWQVDEDPSNFALLDAVPVGCPFFKSMQAVSNDLVFLTEAGVRSMGIAGASTNLQAGSFGKQIDPLVLAAIAAGQVPDSLYFPGQGQYWLFFGAEAFVLTMNGGKSDMSWSRYVFPSAIDDWTIMDQDLILRSGDKIWRVDDATLIDDSGDANVVFPGEVWWQYLDFGALGQTKQMIGFDTVADGEYSVVFGYNQRDAAQATTPYTITNGDTIVGDIIPMPIAAPSFQMRLTFTGNTAWEWSASALYLQDWRRTA